MTPVEKAIDAALAPFIKSATKRAEAVDAVDSALLEEGHLIEDIETVEVIGSRVAVEQVTAYGLDISIDAGGNAVQVTSAYGLEVVE